MLKSNWVYSKLKKILDYLLGVPKTLYVNFRLCRLKDAVKLPIVVSRKVKFVSLSGYATFDKVRPGIVRIGFGSVETLDYQYERTLLFIKGHAHFKGKAKIGKGSRISITGKCTFGDQFHLSAAGKIICRKDIEFGEKVLVSWETLITDTDHHAVFDQDTNKRINPNKHVIIGNNCWIGARANILKGVSLASNTVVGSSSVVTGIFKEENTCLAGNPAKIIRKNTCWAE